MFVGPSSSPVPGCSSIPVQITDDDGAEKKKTRHGSQVEVLEEPVEHDEGAASPMIAKTDEYL